MNSGSCAAGHRSARTRWGPQLRSPAVPWEGIDDALALVIAGFVLVMVARDYDAGLDAVPRSEAKLGFRMGRVDGELCVGVRRRSR
jgi:hypothetical protein